MVAKSCVGGVGLAELAKVGASISEDCPTVAKFVGKVLTTREVEVLALLARGLTIKEIGILLGIATKTVDVHRTNMSNKLRVRGAVGLTHYAIVTGMLRPMTPDEFRLARSSLVKDPPVR